MRGFDDVVYAPHSRYTGVKAEDIAAKQDLELIAVSDEAGVFIAKSTNSRHFFVFGHPEYDTNTLQKEYLRDKAAGLPIHVPENYFPNDDDTQPPQATWRSHANLLYQNWLNYFVYQETPYDLHSIGNA